MSKGQEELKACELCGATIYPEHMKAGTADQWMGKLLCKHCLDEKKQLAAVNPAAAFAAVNPRAEMEPVSLVIDETEVVEANAPPPPAPAPGRGSAANVPARHVQYRRPLAPESSYATRCKTFHCRLSPTAMANLNEMINEWVDASDDIAIKFATNCIGNIEGKSSSDPNLFVTVFY